MALRLTIVRICETIASAFLNARGGGLCLGLFLIPGPLSSLVHAGEGWQSGSGYRWRELAPQESGRIGFTLVSGANSGVLFTNVLSEERGIQNRNLLSGSGVAAGDVDGDGWCDLYFCGLDRGNRLYRNRGNWSFEDMTEAAGVACPGLDSTGSVLADVDGDGDLDLLVNTMNAGLRLFRNEGKGQFKETTQEAGVQSGSAGMSLALADVNGDGALDLYVVNYRRTTIMDRPKTNFRINMIEGQPVVAFVNDVSAATPEYTNRFLLTGSGEVLELGEPDVLYLNDGKGRFTAVSFTGGAFLDEDGLSLREPPRDWGLSVQMRDFSGDGVPDIYVCNDLHSPDRVWINNGKGQFRAIARTAIRCTSTFSMGIDFGDLNRDGFVDFMVVDMLATGHKDRHTQVSQSKPMRVPPGVYENRPQNWRNTLFINRGDGTFQETAFYGGVEASNWSWMPMFLDVDLDGYEDILIPNGQMRDFQNADLANRIEAMRMAKQLTMSEITSLLKMFPDFSTPSLAFRNRRDLTFEEVGSAWGFNAKGVAQGTTKADLDNDGDLDVIVNRLNQEAVLYRNDTSLPRLAVELKGKAPNTSGIGAKVTVTGGPVSQWQEVIAGGHYLAGPQSRLMFAAGSLSNELQVEVRWRNGAVSQVSGMRGNRLVVVDEEAATVGGDPVPSKPRLAPLFEDASKLVAHVHHENDFDDFDRQPLLPYRISQSGPGVAWYDVDGDSHEDLVIGAGRGGTLGVYLSDGAGGLRKCPETILDRPLGRDSAGVLGLSGVIFTGSANYEDGTTNGGCLRLVDLQRKVSGEIVTGQSFSAGALAAADVDGDGSLELFVGGRVVPGRYPEPAPSLLLQNQNGRFVLRQRFEALGLVTGAVFSDLDGDCCPELLLATEWGPVRVFRWDGSKYGEITNGMGLDRFRGWWTGITTGDFDGDGRLDIAVGNWGLNSIYAKPSEEWPRLLYYGDLVDRGTVDLVEAFLDPVQRQELPLRGLIPVMAAMPFVQERIRSFEVYGNANLAQIYGDPLKKLKKLSVNTLASMVFLNRGEKWEPVLLPWEAQLAPAYGLTAADFDGDGHEDLFLSQNLYATALEFHRNDAGRGLLLRGDGAGGFRAVPGQESGIEVYGEQRGCAAGDYDLDGRLDLVVTQNGASTRLFHNVSARPGIVVRVSGPVGNPQGYGTQLRIRAGGKEGPVREIHGGSGYWSQDAPSQVLAVPSRPAVLLVQWRDGRKQVFDVPERALAISVSADGSMKTLKSF